MAELKSSRKFLYQRIHRALKSMDEGERTADTLRRRDQEFDWFEADPGCTPLYSDIRLSLDTLKETMKTLPRPWKPRMFFNGARVLWDEKVFNK